MMLRGCRTFPKNSEKWDCFLNSRKRGDIKIISYIRSFFRPVVKETNEEIKVIIRGIIFEGFSWDDLYQQIHREIDIYRKKLCSDTTNAMFMQGGSGFYGKWNTGLITMNNARKNLEALESFLEK